MLHANEIQQRFNHVEQAIGQAAQACSAERNLPSELRTCIQKLDLQSDLVKLSLQSNDPVNLRKMVDDLAQLGERAKRVCSSADLTAQIKCAVTRMHDELSSLKQQLH